MCTTSCPVLGRERVDVPRHEKAVDPGRPLRRASEGSSSSTGQHAEDLVHALRLRRGLREEPGHDRVEQRYQGRGANDESEAPPDPRGTGAGQKTPQDMKTSSPTNPAMKQPFRRRSARASRPASSAVVTTQSYVA